jgi:hypothetical protein
MIDELVEVIVPGGAWLAAGVAIGAAFGGALRPAAVRLVAAGMTAAERLQEAGAEAYEKTQDIVAEARHEREKKNGAVKSRPATTSRRAARPE